MSAPIGGVLAASAVVSSPVLWLLQEGTLTPVDAVQRWAICIAICWVAITVVGAFAFPAANARPQSVRTEAEETEPAEAQ